MAVSDRSGRGAAISSSARKRAAALNLRAPVVIAATLVLGIGWGVGSLLLQRHLIAEEASGADLNPVARLLADGSGVRTAWPGFCATVLFLVATLRLVVGPAEPPAGKPRHREWTASQLRQALRAEYRWVRAALFAVAAIATIDAERALVYTAAAARGLEVASNSVGGTAVEASGLLCATLVLWLWVTLFRRQLQRWGAI
jgi:hypothetical protein